MPFTPPMCWPNETALENPVEHITICSSLIAIREHMFPKSNSIKSVEKFISLILLTLVGLNVKHIAAYLVWLNIYLFPKNSIITELRQNATFGTQFEDVPCCSIISTNPYALQCIIKYNTVPLVSPNHSYQCNSPTLIFCICTNPTNHILRCKKFCSWCMQ